MVFRYRVPVREQDIAAFYDSLDVRTVYLENLRRKRAKIKAANTGNTGNANEREYGNKRKAKRRQ